MADTKIQLWATPQSLMDEGVSIRATGLQPNMKVTVIATCVIGGINRTGMFHSFAHFIANDNGSVNITNMPSVDGSYVGVEPMGLFWSMTPSPGQKPGLRFSVNDVTRPILIKLTLIEGHSTPVNEFVFEFHEGNRECLQSCLIERWYLKWDGSVLRIPVKSGAIRGTLFVPKSGGPYPGVIDMFGTAGGLIEFRAALLASHGFAALALAYFGYDDLPAGIELNLEYFSNAVDWLEKQPFVLKHSLGVVGVSLGANLACALPQLNNKIKAVVAINGTHYYNTGTFHYKGSQVPAFYSLGVELSDGDYYKLSSLYPVSGYPDIDQSTIPIQNAPPSTRFLFIHGADDQLTNPEHGLVLAKRLQEGRQRRCRLIIYPGAGHLIEPPHVPLSRFVFAKLIGGVADYGGDIRMHADAQESAWRELISFLRAELINTSRLVHNSNNNCHDGHKSRL